MWGKGYGFVEKQGEGPCLSFVPPSASRGGTRRGPGGERKAPWSPPQRRNPPRKAWLNPQGGCGETLSQHSAPFRASGILHLPPGIDPQQADFPGEGAGLVHGAAQVCRVHGAHKVRGEENTERAFPAGAGTRCGTCSGRFPAKEASTRARAPTSSLTRKTTVALSGAARGVSSRERMRKRVVLVWLVWISARNTDRP